MQEHSEKELQYRGYGICLRWMLLFLMLCFVLFLDVHHVFAIDIIEFEWGEGTSHNRRVRYEEFAQAAPLRAGPAGVAAFTSPAFLYTVGGINFEAVASPSWSLWWALWWQDIHLAYQRTEPDGHRIAITIGNTSYRPFIPDWQLKTIAPYADQKHTAAVSLLGEGPNRTKEFYITYHEALKDTLLGWRLFQADGQLRKPSELWRLPKQRGITIRSAEERAPNEAVSRKAAAVIEKIFAQYPPEGWLLTDIGTHVTMSIEKNELKIEAAPYYYFWNAREKQEKELSAAEIRELETCMAQLLGPYYFPGNPGERQWSSAEEQKMYKCLGKYIVVEANDKLTNYFKDNRVLIEQLNPAVYDAVIQTARFAAFFRYMKRKNPSAWQAFLSQVKNIDLASINVPTVKTPNVWEK